jgi:AraC family transcriptional regulator
VAIEASSSLQRSVFMSGRGFSYFAETDGLPLSLKSVSNGRALYKVDRRETAVDDAGYLIVNEGRPYSIEIASPTLVETFVLWFPRGLAEEVCQSLNQTAECLLDGGSNERPIDFFERYTPHDQTVSPKLRVLRAAFKAEKKIEDIWLEESLRKLLAAMLGSQTSVRQNIGCLPATRAATRAELWRRANIARDYLHAHLAARVRLSEVAKVACLSPFHLLRVFQSAFGLTPHRYLNQCRLERAKFLLEKTRIPVTSICLECGYTSLGSFSILFRKYCGLSPRAWRQTRGVKADENSNIREVFLMGAT